MSSTARLGRVTTVAIPLVVALTVIAATVGMAILASSAADLERRQQAAATAEARAESLDGALEREAASVEALAAFVSTTLDEPAHTLAEFPVFAEALFDESGSTLSLQLVEGTVISEVYPLERNRAAIGLDLTDRPSRRALVEQSIATGRTIVEGPIELVQGGTGLVIRKPIYHDGAFWGFGAAVIDWNAIPAVAAFGAEGEIVSALRSVDDGTVIAGSPGAFDDEDAVVRTIATTSLGSVWELAVADLREGAGQSLVAVWLLGGLVAVLAALYLRSVLRRPEILSRERELALRELAEAEARYQAIFEHAGIGMSVADGRGRLIRRNDTFDGIFGTERVGGDLRTIDLLHNSEVAGYLELVDADFEIGESYDFDFRTRSPIEQWVHVQVTRIPDAGAEHRYLGVVQDVTESRRMEAALAESERRFRELFEKTPVAVQREDHTEIAAMLEALEAQGVDDIESHLSEHRELLEQMVSKIRLLDANPAARALMRRLGFETSGHRMGERLDDDSARGFIRSMVGIAHGRSTQLYPTSAVSRDGERVYLDVVWYAPVDEDGRPDYANVFVAFNDNTELRKTQLRLERMLESKNRFVASVAHELRTPLTAVVGFAHELRGDQDLGVEERSEFRDLIAFHADEMSHMIEDLLVWSRTDIGEVRVHIETVDVAKAAERTVQSIPDHAIRRLGPESGISAMCDPVRVRQIVRNLVTNALRHGGDSIAYDVAADGEWVSITVRDDGPEIPSDQAERMFEPYERLGESVTSPGSIGLGLAVSRTLARLQGGDLVLRREDGWNVFELSLPPADPEREAGFAVVEAAVFVER